MKNLVNNEEKEKMKEELAWQVAEMIVRDVTSVTMPEKEGREERQHQWGGVEKLQGRGNSWTSQLQ